MRRPRRSTSTPWLVLGRVVLLAAMLGSLAIPSSTSSALAAGQLSIPNPWADEGMEVLGELPNPWFDGEPGSLTIIDEERQRGYGTFSDVGGFRIGEYDMSTEIPTPLRISDAPVSRRSGSRDTVAIDHERRRLLVIGTSGAGDQSVIEVIDLETLTSVASWDLTQVVPGFVAYGFTLDEQRDRLYLAGEFMGNINLKQALSNIGYNAIGPGPAIIALDPADGDVVWAAPLPQCHQLLNSPTGTLVGVSIHRPALYVFCTTGKAAQQTTGQGGLLRVDITGEEQASGVVNLPSEFFPVSGQYAGTSSKTGVTGFDPTSERFFAQSLAARTPGAWVFDGLRGSWVGFIAAPDDRNESFGLNTANGRHYQAGKREFNTNTGYINVADARATPVPQGTLFENQSRLEGGIYFTGQLTVDPGTGRLFSGIYVQNPDPEEGQPVSAFIVLRDTTVGIDPLAPPDLDALTHDLDDGEAFLLYAAGTTGFGARYLTVGGWEGIYDRVRNPTTTADQPLPLLGRNPAGLSTGDRGVTFAQVPGVDIRESGASAAAASSGVDSATASDAEKAPDDQGSPVTFTSYTDQFVSCLDGTGESQHLSEGGEPTDAGFAEVVCDLEESRADGRARYNEETAFPGLSTGSSSIDTRTYREDGGAAVNETEAVAEGISISVGGEEAFSIDRVTATLTVRADGRPGGSTAVWTRTIEGAATPGGSPRSCTTTVTAGTEQESTGDCDALEDEMNRQLGTKIKVRFPTPSVVATPQGAFAQVRKSETDLLTARATNNDDSLAPPAMELVYLSDHAEKSRVVVQYAAVNGYAQMVRTPLGSPTDLPGSGSSQPPAASQDDGGAATQPGGSTGGGAPGTGTSDLVSQHDTGVPDVDGPSGGDEPVPPEPEVADTVMASHRIVTGGWVPVTRSLKDAIFMASLMGLFALAPLEAVHRRRLLNAVT